MKRLLACCVLATFLTGCEAQPMQIIQIAPAMPTTLAVEIEAVQSVDTTSPPLPEVPVVTTMGAETMLRSSVLSSDVMNEADVDAILANIMPKALSLLTRYRIDAPVVNGNPGEDGYYAVEGSISGMKSEIESVFTVSIAQQEFYVFMFDLAQYKEIEGQLYVNPEYSGSIWSPVIDWQNYQIISADNTEIILQMPQTQHADLASATDFKTSVVVKLVKSDSNSWKIDSKLF